MSNVEMGLVVAMVALFVIAVAFWTWQQGQG